MFKKMKEAKILNDQIAALERDIRNKREKRKNLLTSIKSKIRSKDRYQTIICKMYYFFLCSKKAKETHHLLKVSDQAWNGIYIKENNLVPVCSACHEVCHSKDKHYKARGAGNPVEVSHLDSRFKQTVMWLAVNMSDTEKSWEQKLCLHWKYQFLIGATDVQELCYPYFVRRQSEVYVLFSADYPAKALIGKETKHKIHILVNEGRLFELFEPLDSPFSPDHPIYNPNLRAEWITAKPTFNGG